MTVYFVQDKKSKLIKIGFSATPEKRVQTVRRVLGRDVDVLAFIEGGREIEKMLHAQLASDRREGEWFAPSEAVMNAVTAARSASAGVNKNAKRAGIFDETGEDIRIAFALLQRLIGTISERNKSKYAALEQDVLPALQEINPSWTIRRLRSIQCCEAGAVRFWMIRNMLEALGSPMDLADLIDDDNHQTKE